MTLDSKTTNHDVNKHKRHSLLNKQTQLETDLLKNMKISKNFYKIKDEIKSATMNISIFFKQIKIDLNLTIARKLYILRKVPKTCKKSYSIHSRLARIRDYLVFDDILKSANRYIQSKPQLLSATQTSICLLYTSDAADE